MVAAAESAVLKSRVESPYYYNRLRPPNSIVPTVRVPTFIADLRLPCRPRILRQALIRPGPLGRPRQRPLPPLGFP